MRERRPFAPVRGKHGGMSRRGVGRLASILALCFALLALAAAFAPLSPSDVPVAAAHPAAPARPAHAFLLRSDPAADAILNAPPRRVRLWFSEDINALTSRAVVVDTTNKEVDEHDSNVSRSDAKEMDVDVPPLAAGTYVVAWRVQSADDGHVTGGSFIFRIARPDGTVPPVPPVLPSGNVPGAGNVGASGGQLDGPTWLQTVATWLALLLMTFWVGGLIWETWILAPVGMERPALAAAGQSAAERFRRLAPWALGGLLVANVVIALAFSAQLAGSWSGLFALPLLGAILFGSRFGAFLLVREAVAALALIMAVLELRRQPYAVSWRVAGDTPAAPEPLPEPKRLADIGPWLLAALRAMPGALARGWARRTRWGQGVLLLGAALVVAFGFSGHAAAVPEGELAYAVSVDLLHLFGEAAWVGGLLYIAVVLVPALRRLPSRARAEMLARGLPHFSALAVITVLVLALTGSLNTAVHLTSITQFLTTSYGQTLAIKIELFLIMAAISAYHAFRLRPRLAVSLASDTGEASGAVDDAVGAQHASDGSDGSDGSNGARPRARGAAPRAQVAQMAERASSAPASRTVPDTPRTEEVQEAKPASASPAPRGGGGQGMGAATLNLAAALEDWLQREAALGVAILACVALLGAFAGSLAPPAPPAPAHATPYISAPQVAGGLSVTLRVDPAAFGTNTFTVAVHDTNGKPVDGAGVSIATQMLDMDMGIQTTQLKPAGQPGIYSAQADLTMAGHWQIFVRVLPANSDQIQTFDYHFSVAY